MAAVVTYTRYGGCMLEGCQAVRWVSVVATAGRQAVAMREPSAMVCVEQ